MSEVVWVDTRQMSFENSIRHKLLRLSEAAGIIEDLLESMQVAVKINTAEAGYEYGLRPNFIQVFTEVMEEKTLKCPLICDGQRLVDYWRKARGNTFLKTAGARGYSKETLGGLFLLNGGFSGDEGDLYPCGSTESELGGVEVGAAVCRADALRVLSHVTLHPLFGINGALLNSGFECLSGRARTRVLQGLSPYIFNGSRPGTDQVNGFHRRALESCFGVRNAVEERIFYVNYLWDVTPQPEYYPFSEGPVVENIGFLASNDPVALDGATWALITKQNPAIEEMVGVDFPGLIRTAADMGLGSAEWSIRQIS